MSTVLLARLVWINFLLVSQRCIHKGQIGIKFITFPMDIICHCEFLIYIYSITLT